MSWCECGVAKLGSLGPARAVLSIEEDGVRVMGLAGMPLASASRINVRVHDAAEEHI